MHLRRIVILAMSSAAIVSCNNDEVLLSELPPLAGVRYVNAVADTGAVDIRMIDQLEFTAFANALSFRAGTEHQATEAKLRRIRVFATSADPAVTSKFLVDTAISFEASKRYTLLLTGSGRSGGIRFVVISDDAPTVAAGTIHLRAVNASTGAVNTYVLGTAAEPLPAQPTAGNVTPFSSSAYVTRTAGA